MVGIIEEQEAAAGIGGLPEKGRQVMKSIIEQFYYGELNPCEMPVPTTKKYKETLALLTQTEEEFVKRFPETKNTLTELKDLMHTISALESLNDFTRGFRFGAKFMLDVLSKDESK